MLKKINEAVTPINLGASNAVQPTPTVPNTNQPNTPTQNQVT